MPFGVPAVRRRAITVKPVTCPGALIVHADGTIAGCTLDDDEDKAGGLAPT